MRPKPDFYKRRTGKTLEEKRRERMTAEQVVNKRLKGLKSSYPVRLMGIGQDKLFITEEEREANVHIIGQPRQGKSKLIEDQIRKDIDLGNGLCLLDPSDNGDTAKKVLRYCALKGIKNVVYIDPDTLFKYGKIATIQPLKQFPYLDQSVDMLMESVNALFGISKQTDTNRIKRNFEALITLLAKRRMTLYETKYFRNYTDAKQLPFLNSDEDSRIVADGFANRPSFENYFLTTVGRLNVFRKEPISLMTAADNGIDFIKMIDEGWVILVNLHPGASLPKVQSRLLGILIISEIMHAVGVMFKWKPEGEIKRIFYLYIDEAARFASPQIEDIIEYMGKTGLRLVIAHHEFYQFRKQNQEGVLKAIKNGCRIKMMFNMSDYKDRLEMCEDLGYGGEIHPTLAAYVQQNIPKREMVIKKDKETPVRIKVPNVPDISRSELPDERLEEYIRSILDQPWYLSKQQIQDQINARTPTIRTQGNDSQTAQPRAENDGKTNRKSRVSDQKNVSSKWKDVS